METTIKGILDRINEIYAAPDDQQYELEDLIYYHQKFLLRFFENKSQLKKEETEECLAVATTWFVALMNRFHLDLESNLLKRYSYKCPFCLSIPCECTGEQKSKKTGRPVSRKPKDIDEWQELVGKIYPDGNENIDFDLLLKQDNLHQLFRQFRKQLGRTVIKDIEVSCTDYFVSLLRVFNLLDIKASDMFRKYYENGCYVCGKSPCHCYFNE